MKPGINNEQISTQKGENIFKDSIFCTESGNILQPFQITASDGSSAFRKKSSML